MDFWTWLRQRRGGLYADNLLNKLNAYDPREQELVLRQDADYQEWLSGGESGQAAKVISQTNQLGTVRPNISPTSSEFLAQQTKAQLEALEALNFNPDDDVGGGFDYTDPTKVPTETPYQGYRWEYSEQNMRWIQVPLPPNARDTNKPAPGGAQIRDGGDGWMYEWDGKEWQQYGKYDPTKDPKSRYYKPDFTSGTPLPEGVDNVRWMKGYKEIYDPKGNNGQGEWIGTGEYVKEKDPEYLLWREDRAAENAAALQNLAWQQGQADLDRQARKQEQEAQLAAQKQERLAQLASQPAAYYQRAALGGYAPQIQPWMLPLMSQQYAGLRPGDEQPGWKPPTEETGQPMTSLPELTRPSSQYQARMGSTGYQQYLGYQQARTGATPEDTQFQLWNYAPPSGRNRGLTYTR